MSPPVDGESVKIWPAHERVRLHPDLPRFIPVDDDVKANGFAVKWSAWWDEQLRGGEIYLTNPTPAKPAPSSAAPVKAAAPVKE